MIVVQQPAGEKEEIVIYADREGLELLRTRIGFLLNGSTHDHLMTESWAGTELNDQPIAPLNPVIKHVEIVRLEGGRPAGAPKSEAAPGLGDRGR
jgi:hypothetical protein